jgi:hypothetical protein
LGKRINTRVKQPKREIVSLNRIKPIPQPFHIRGIYWTCLITRLVIEQVSQKTRIFWQNPRFLLFLSGSCSETEVSEQLYYKKCGRVWA